MIARRAFLGFAAFTLAAISGCGLWPKTRTPALAAETPAPAFDLEDHSGKRVSLADLTKRGPALLVFYRGYW